MQLNIINFFKSFTFQINVCISLSRTDINYHRTINFFFFFLQLNNVTDNEIGRMTKDNINTDC